MPNIETNRVDHVGDVTSFDYDNKCLSQQLSNKSLFERAKTLYEKTYGSINPSIVRFDGQERLALSHELNCASDMILCDFKELLPQSYFDNIENPMNDTIEYLKSVGDQYSTICVAITETDCYFIPDENMTNEEILIVVEQIREKLVEIWMKFLLEQKANILGF